ncbi:MAG: glycosyltransferase, partial [Anaerovoracaceae bacterium]
RDEQIFKEKNQFAERLTLPFNSEQREYLGKIINRYADEIIIHDDELLAHIPGNKMDRVHIVPLRMDLDKFQPVEASSEGESVVIAHAPSNRKIKGTIYIEQAVENLAKKYDLEFVLVENMTQEQAIEQYRRADIVIDQMLIGTYGVFAIETMALGKPVITYLTEEMQASLPESLPIVSGNPDTVEQVLEALIQDKERRVQLGKAGRAYVETYHDCNKNAKLLMKIYQGKHQPKVGREAFEEVVEK